MGIRDRIQARFGRGHQVPDTGARRQRRPSFSQDIDPDADIIRNMWQQSKVLSPKSKNKEQWDSLLKYIACYFSITLPLIWAFKLDPHWAWLIFDYVLDILFWADIAVSLRTSFYTAENELVVTPRLIFERYRKLWLPVDVAGAIPWELFALAAGENKASFAFAFTRMFKAIFRLSSQLGKDDKRREVVVRNIVLADLGRTGRLLTRFLFFAHWVACMWWIIGAWEGEEELNKPPHLADNSALTYWPLRPQRGSIRIDWNTSLAQQYFSSYYWSLSTLMKTAWIPPGTVGEKAFASVIVFLGAIIFAFIVGNVSAVVKAFDAANSRRRDKIAAMRRFADTRKLGAGLTSQLLAYVDAEWTWTDGISTLQFLKEKAEIPGNMRADLLFAFHDEICGGAHLFKGIGRDCMKMLLEELVPQAVVKKATLIQGGRLCLDVFILMKGTLQLTMVDTPPAAGRTISKDDAESGRNTSSSTVTRTKTMSKKMGSNFRMIERPGSCIGFMNPYDTPWTAPFTVVGAKLSFLFGVRGAAIREILGHFEGTKDAESLLANLKAEFAQCAGKEGVAAQEARLQEKRAATSAALPAPQTAPDVFAQLGLPENEQLADDVSGSMNKCKDELMKSQDALTVSRVQLQSMKLVHQAIGHLLDPTKHEKPDYDALTKAYDSAIAADMHDGDTTYRYTPRSAMKANRSKSVAPKRNDAYDNSKRALQSQDSVDAFDSGARANLQTGTDTVENTVVASAVM